MRLGAGVQITPNVRLLRHLAEGGMGSVWLAEHLALDCQVAVKFIMPELRSSCPSVVERFKREGKVAAQITSPHVVRVFDQGTTDDDTPYIVMELLRGDSLADWLSFVGPLSLAETARLVRQVTSVLERAHDLGVIHRDIKPANLFLVESTEELFVKVLDFGIAKATRLPAGDGLTVAGALMGTPDYMSPERLLRADEVEPASDYWSLAVVAYQALTGCLPFSGETLAALIVAITSGRVTPPSLVRADLPDALDRWALRALAHRPEDRFGSGPEMAEALEGVAERAAGQLPTVRASSFGRDERPSAHHESTTAPGSAALDAATPDATTPASLAPDSGGPLLLWSAPPRPTRGATPPAAGSPTAAARQLIRQLELDSSLAEERWDVLFGGSDIGPVTTKLLLRGLETGNIPQEVKVRRTGTKRWLHLAEAAAGDLHAPTEADEVDALSLPPPEPPSLPPATTQSTATTHPRAASRNAGWLGLAAFACLAGAAFWVAQARDAGDVATIASSPSATASPEPNTGQERARRVCEAARSRLYAGASMGMDVDGWVVELWLARDAARGPLADDPSFRGVLAGDRITRGVDRYLDALEVRSGHAELRPGDDSTLGVSHATLALTGEYVRAFLTLDGRHGLESLAAQTLAATGADFGALYARCAHLTARDIGAWYGGRGSHGAAAAMLFAAGAFCEPAALDRERVGGDALLPELAARAATLDEAVVREVLARGGATLSTVGGAVKGEALPHAVVRFPFGGPTRAIGASRELVGKLEL